MTLTWITVGGAALIVHAALGIFLGMDRKLTDQAEQIEQTGIRRIG
ncbi:MAG: hypothetical protein WCF24_00935 [Acidimicrobiales bacterium]